MRVAALIVGGVCLVALGGCGGGGPAIDARGAELLQAEVAAARTATARGDRTEAVEMLQTIDNTVDALRKQDKITSSRAAAVHAAVEKVRAALERNALPPTTTVPAPTSPPVTNPPVTNPRPQPEEVERPGDRNDGNDEKGRANRRDKKGDDDDDD